MKIMNESGFDAFLPGLELENHIDRVRRRSNQEIFGLNISYHLLSYQHDFKSHFIKEASIHHPPIHTSSILEHNIPHKPALLFFSTFFLVRQTAEIAMSPYSHQEEEVFQAVALFENSSFEASEPLITSPTSNEDYEREHHHDAGTHATSNILLLNTQSNGDSFLFVQASLLLGFAISFLAHLSVMGTRIFLQMNNNNNNKNMHIKSQESMHEILGASMFWALSITLVMAVIYHLFLFIVVSIVNMMMMVDTNSNKNTESLTHDDDDNAQQQLLLLLEKITTRTWYRFLLGGLVGACSAFFIAAWMIGQTELVPLCIVIMISSVGIANCIMFCNSLEKSCCSSSKNQNCNNNNTYYDYENIAAAAVTYAV